VKRQGKRMRKDSDRRYFLDGDDVEIPLEERTIERMLCEKPEGFE
jgi:hypothetical protein